MSWYWVILLCAVFFLAGWYSHEFWVAITTMSHM